MTSDERDFAVELYLSGVSLGECAIVLEHTKQSIWALLKRRGIPRRASGGTKRCTVDDAFFDTIDSEEKAYWLGFISADGTIGKNDVITLTLGIKDAAHVHAFAKALESTYKVSSAVYDGFGRCSTSIVSRQLIERLGRLGVHRNKSLTIRPAAVPAKLERHYWRGVVDGDGSIHRRGTRGGRRRDYIVNLVGTREMLAGFTKAVQRNLRLPKPEITPNGSICITSYANAKAQKVAHWLYDTSRVALVRKATAS